MSERAAFLRAIRQRPDDDLPRLAYADWLDEQGDPRGEFLRKQCEGVSLYRELQPFLQVPGYSTNPQFLQLKHTFDATVTRSKALEKKHRKEWIPKPLSPDASFQRGFVSEAKLTPGEVLGHLETLYQTEPLPDLTLKNHASFARVDELVQLPVLSEVCGLGFSAPVTDAHIAKVLGSPRLGELRRLKLTATKCRTLGIAGLSQAELPQLEELFLANLKLDRLLDLARFPRLKTLHARDNPRLADLGVLSGLSELETLDLTSTHCTDLSPVGSVVSLRKLNLGGVKDLTSLAPLASLTRLEQLWLSMTGVGDLSPLSGMSSLKSLDLAYTKVTDLSPLAALENLEELHLNQTWVRDLTPLATCSRLRVLRLDQAPVADLQPLYAMSNLRELSLGRSPATGEQLQALKQALPECRIL